MSTEISSQKASKTSPTTTTAKSSPIESSQVTENKVKSTLDSIFVSNQQLNKNCDIEENNEPRRSLNDILTKWSSDPLNETMPLVQEITAFSEKNLKIFIDFVTALDAYKNFILTCELYRRDIQIDLPSEKELLDIIAQQPYQYFDYQFIILKNFLTYNRYVRGDYFEDLKTVAPYQQKEIQFQAKLIWLKVSHLYRKLQRNQKKWIQLKAAKYGSVESGEIAALRIDNLNQLIEEKLPAKAQQIFYQAVSYFAGFLEEPNKDRILKCISTGSEQVEGKIASIEKKKSEIQEKIIQLKQQQETLASSDVTIKESNKEAELKKIEDLYVQQSYDAEVAFQRDYQFTWRSREENRLNLLKINEGIVAKDEKYAYDVIKQAQQNEIDQLYGIQIREQERIEKIETAKKQLKEQLLEEDEKEKQKKIEKEKELNFVEKKITEKQKTQEILFAEKQAKIESDKKEELRKQQKALRKQELLNFEQSLIAQEEKNQQLLKLKKKVPAKKPEQLALEKALMEELKQIRLQEEAEEAERLRLEEIALKLAQKTLQEKIGEKIQQKQDKIYEKALEMNQSISDFGEKVKASLTLEPFKAAGRFVGTNIGEILLWSTSIVSTLFFGPLDNLKLLNQLGQKGSEFARKDFSEKAKIYKPIPKPDPSAKLADQLKELSKVIQEPNTATKGNLIRLLKHNILGSDIMALAFFKITQDNLMMYTQGQYQNYNNFIAGAVSGAIMGFLMNPIDLFKTLYVATDLKLQFQLKNLKFLPYKGLMPNVYSNALFRGMQFSLYELLKKRIYMKEYSITQDAFSQTTSYKNFNAYNNYLSLGQKYAAAVSAMFVSSVVSYPLDTAKRYIFADIYAGMSNNRLTSISQALSIYGNWYGGFKYQCYKIAFQPISIILWDHLASKLCAKTNIHNTFY